MDSDLSIHPITRAHITAAAAALRQASAIPESTDYIQTMLGICALAEQQLQGREAIASMIEQATTSYTHEMTPRPTDGSCWSANAMGRIIEATVKAMGQRLADDVRAMSSTPARGLVSILAQEGDVA